ncbi:MAG: class I SAM-dependent DNA methyltransferase [Thermoguttaceae bacterium]
MHPCPENVFKKLCGTSESKRLEPYVEISSLDMYGMEPSRTEDYDAVRLPVIRQRWDQKADRWDADVADQCCHLNQDDSYRRFLDAADSIVAARESFCRDRLLVDLACGTGLVLAHFADRFNRALGVDISPRMLAAAAARQLPRVELLEASCFELAGRIAAAGAVLSRGILLSHYGHRWVVPLLGQVRDILSPDGGFAILDFLNALTRYDYPANPDNKTYYTAEQIRSQADEAGFCRSSILGEPNRRILLLLAER